MGATKYSAGAITARARSKPSARLAFEVGLVLLVAILAYKMAAPQPKKVVEEPSRVFADIYEKKIWGENAAGVGRSGSGSTLAATVLYRTFLQDFMRLEKIASVVDAGCGDWESARALDWTGINYRGYDIVDKVIAKNRDRYQAANIHFYTADILTEPLPSADLLICKHVLQHLPNRDVFRFLPQLRKFKHALLVDSVDAATLTAPNDDIHMGEFRPLDITRPPFRVHGAKVLTYWDGEHMQQVVHVH